MAVEKMKHSELVKIKKMMSSKDTEMSSLGKKLAFQAVNNLMGISAVNDEIARCWIDLLCNDNEIDYYVFHKTEEEKLNDQEDVSEA